MRVAPVSIDHVLVRPEVPVAQRCCPERADIHLGVLGYRDGDDLDLRWIRFDAQLAGRGRDPACELDIRFAQRAVLPGCGSYRDAIGSDIHIGVVADLVSSRGDRGYEPRCFRERSDAEVRVGAGEQDAPVLDAGGGVKLRGGRALHEGPVRRPRARKIRS